MSIKDDVAAFILGGGSKSASFPNIGDRIKGTIVSAEQQQQTDYHTKAPKTWDNGDPMMQVVITLQTDERDPSEPGDDGQRAIYIKGSPKVPTTTRGALGAALKAAGVTTIEEGGTLALQYIGGAGVSGDPKQWKCAYKAPDRVAVGDLLADDPAPAAPKADDGFLDAL